GRKAAYAREASGDGTRPPPLSDGRHPRRPPRRSCPAGTAFHHGGRNDGGDCGRHCRCHRRCSRRPMSARFLACLALALLTFGGGPAIAQTSSQTQTRPLLIGTGPVVGLHFPAGGAICNMINRAAGMTVCAVVVSEGSAANLAALKAGSIDLAIVQSDWQYHAVQGQASENAETRFDGLRAVFSLYSEPVTIVARRDSGIASVEDLKGKRVNLGLPGSSGRASAEALIAAMGWSLKDFGSVGELAPEHQPE